MASAEEYEIADHGRTAVGACTEMVDVAEGRWPAAALGDAAAVAGSDGAALASRDLVGQRGEADDLSVVVEHNPLDPRLTQKGLDLSSSRRSGPRPGGAVGARVSLEI